MLTPRASASTSSGSAYSRSIRSRTRRSSASSRRCCASSSLLVTSVIVPSRTGVVERLRQRSGQQVGYGDEALHCSGLLRRCVDPDRRRERVGTVLGPSPATGGGRVLLRGHQLRRALLLRQRRLQHGARLWQRRRRDLV